MVSCKPKDGEKQAFVVNNSTEEIVFIFSDSFPDTVNFNLLGCSTKDKASIVQPSESKYMVIGGTSYVKWEEYLTKFPSSTAMVFIYNAEEAGKIADNLKGCDSLYKRPDLILKRFDMDINYLISNNWRLTYP